MRVVKTHDRGTVTQRYLDLRAAYWKHVERAWIGTLVMDFTNDELGTLADMLTIGETLILRRLGLLGPDEGYDGSRR